ncbi:aminotransferase class I/II-fold pyridoxal phosphate-dependent enzyme [Robertmurraya yapensis]|uniref:Aminotransferase class I/II-fold pyridoxal phosphate-dependent enzyme n=1 Tax=Bacillus yapensis TaxID=2492960 RepID=A0A3S0KR38_9BACI|nr:aminotransferase class I/II-fold pyridoxal phosphate-dependent enzyme [Bacillus yapensis]RTR36364.1 aminotransferase class I/II-fold pyridoxal phosphate-dependent enzyme [Bacillus yapensis]TKT05868.1 aminotransferase class I/II-fold pyridoxal phosphate-dependent enzyme [Bacillus yapensis]
MTNIPFMRPSLVKYEEYKAYLDLIDNSRIYSNFGPINNAFESRILNDYFDNIGGVTTVNNATSGLMLSISQTKRKGAKYAIMPSFTFSATALAAMWCGLEPYFIDVNPEGWEMDTEKLKLAISNLGEQVAVVVPYATFGNNIDLTYYEELHNNGIPVVVDAAPCFGSSKENIQFGTSFSGIVVYSFHATKPFGIGEGGLIYSADTKLINSIKAQSNFSYSGKRESESLGLNAKLSEFHAAIGLATLDVFQEKIQKRIALYNVYSEEISKYSLLDNGWCLQKTTGRIPYQFFSILCPPGESNNKYIKKLQENSINAVSYYNPACHNQKQFQEFIYTDLSITDDISSRVICMPFWEEMDENTIRIVVETLSI